MDDPLLLSSSSALLSSSSSSSLFVDNATIITDYESLIIADQQQQHQLRPSLSMRIFKRFLLCVTNLITFLQNNINEYTATSIASFSVLIIVLSIICCFVISLLREEERKIKEQYKKLNTGSSQSFLAYCSNKQGATLEAAYQNYQKIGYLNNCSNNYNGIQQQQFHNPSYISCSSSSHGGPVRFYHHGDRSYSKVSLIELRRETYFGLVRLLKPACRTVVLLCDAQSSLKLLKKFYQCIYPYRKNKTLQFAFLLIEKNIGWYRELLKLALNERRDLQINPANCIGTVLVLNGFRRYFSVYHASDSRHDPDEPLILLEESLLDNLPGWLEKSLAGRANKHYIPYWPDHMR